MPGMVADPELLTDEVGHATTGPEGAPKAKGFGTFLEQGLKLGELGRSQQRGRPGAGWERSASTPSRVARLSHWLTAPWVTPKASAMRLCVHPIWCSSQARRRRPSVQLVGGSQSGMLML
jgi:hypothetical protein